MRLTESFIRRPVATIMLNVALLVFGLIGLQRLPVRELPDIDPSIVNVLTVYPGANAEVVETEVTERLEESISGADSIRLIRSESRDQVSSIVVEFTQGRDVDLAAQDVRDLVSRVRGQLPDDIDEPVIAKQDSSAQPIIWVAFFSDQHSVEELTFIADTQVKDALQTVPGVSSVILGGEKKYAVRVRLDAARLAAYGLTVIDVGNRLRENNVELPSGRVENSDRELTVRTLGQLHSADAFNSLVLRSDENGVVRLQDVGFVEMGVEDERSRARFKGRPAIGLGIVRQSRANTLQVAEDVKSRMAEVAEALPTGVEFEFPYDESIYVGRAVDEVFRTLGLAFVLVVLTIFLFLRNVRSTIVPSLAIPVSICATFGVLYVLGLTVNIFTLLALVLAIGLVVDDAIVVLENVYRHIEEGMAPFEASIAAIKEIAFAVVATTLSLVAVFLPLVFIGGITGRLLLEFAVALSAAVIVSTIVALTLTPMAAARILKPIEKQKHGSVYNWLEVKFDRLNDRYERWLDFALRRRALIVGIAGVSLLVSWYCFANLEREFLPGEDKGRFFSFVITPQGSTPEYTDRMMMQVEEIFEAEDAIEGYFAAVAVPFNGPGDPTFGITFVRLKDGERPHVRDMVDGPNGLMARMIGGVEGAIAIPVLPKAVDTGFSQPFELVVSNPDLKKLDAYVREVNGRLMQEGFLLNVRSNFEITKPELSVSIDRDRAADQGVSIRDISRTLQVLFGGDALSTFKLQGKEYDVIAQLDRTSRLMPQQMDSVYVRADDGRLVQLANLVTLEEGGAPTVIERFGRQRSATIQGTPNGIPLGTAIERAEAILEETRPEGFSYSWKGEARDLTESSNTIYGFMLLAILVVYMVLGAQFESFTSPFVVMLALPLAFLGAFGSLYVLSWVNAVGMGMYGWANYSPDPPAIAGILSAIIPRIASMNMNIFSQVGLILLIGLVTKNSILLVEFANQRRARGIDAKTAMREAGLLRLRPILMTSMATIAGILPIAIGFGDGAESRRPLGVVAVGGMITSTILTLFVIPVMYTLLADFEDALRARIKGEARPVRSGVGGGLKQPLSALLLLLGFGTFSVAAERPTLPAELDLDQAVSLALVHSPVIGQNRARLAESEGVLSTVKSAGLPKLSLSGNYLWLDDDRQQVFAPDMPPQDTTWSADAEASLSIIDGGRKRARLRGARRVRDAERSGVVAAENALVAAVHDVYYAAQLAQEQIVVQRRAVEVLTEQLRLAQNRLDARTATRFEVTQAKVALANAQPALIRAKNDYRRQTNRLRDVVGLPFAEGVSSEDVRLAPQDAPEAVDLSLADAVEQALLARPELLAARNRVGSGLDDITYTKRTTAPRVDIFAGYGAQADQFSEDEVLKGWVGGVRLDWNVFDGGNRRGAVAQARSRLWGLQELERDTVLAVESEVRQAFYNYDEAVSIQRSAGLAVEQAEEALQMATDRYEAGNGTQVDVLDSQLQLTRAALEQSSARFDAHRAIIEIRRAVGLGFGLPASEED